ncbi:Gtr1/RagA G protein Gtr2 [Wolfiporia cocos MD-104 SS10]|uniref:GTP-binding protein n=1 Tax=Wolfiporia cocos (strain MD-104) TaxID=742152 RepID=A0A2H3JWT8_WOLCO|nr:Gtr1/RagA G protein Gtr2 [Wolfiporia cocos MD-104 SS10]
MNSRYGSTSTTPQRPQPAANGHADAGDVARTKLLLMGLRRCGKTSIQQVLFNGLPPKQTLYLERSARVAKHIYDTVIPLEIWDCPGDATLESIEAPLNQFATLIYVIDIQSMLHPSIERLLNIVVTVYQESQATNFVPNLEVFVHKADTMSEDYRLEMFRNIQSRILDELADLNQEYEQIPINFQLTSIHDHSLHDSFSRVLHKSIEALPYLEDLLNVFTANSQASKAFLFDIKSRLYVATDASPVDPPTHNLCSDYLLMLNSFGPLYRSATASPARHQPPSPPHSQTSPSSHAHSPATSAPTSPRAAPHGSPPGRPSKALFYPSASTALAPSAAGAGVGMTITYHLITRHLALLAVLPTAVHEERRGLVEYNVVFLREGVQEICEVEEEARGGG